MGARALGTGDHRLENPAPSGATTGPALPALCRSPHDKDTSPEVSGWAGWGPAFPEFSRGWLGPRGAGGRDLAGGPGRRLGEGPGVWPAEEAGCEGVLGPTPVCGWPAVCVCLSQAVGVRFTSPSLRAGRPSLLGLGTGWWRGVCVQGLGQSTPPWPACLVWHRDRLGRYPPAGSLSPCSRPSTRSLDPLDTGEPRPSGAAGSVRLCPGPVPCCRASHSLTLGPDLPPLLPRASAGPGVWAARGRQGWAPWWPSALEGRGVGCGPGPACTVGSSVCSRGRTNFLPR